MTTETDNAVSAPPVEADAEEATYEGIPLAQKMISGSRYLIIIAIVCTFVAATTLLFYGAFETVQVVAATITGASQGTEKLILSFIKIVDLFLLGTVLYVISVGLYELFIDDSIPLPAWLVIHDLDDLKQKLISVVIAVLSVLFLGQIVSWDGQQDLLRFGVAMGAVIVALTYFLSQKAKKDH